MQKEFIDYRDIMDLMNYKPRAAFKIINDMGAKRYLIVKTKPRKVRTRDFHDYLENFKTERKPKEGYRRA